MKLSIYSCTFALCWQSPLLLDSSWLLSIFLGTVDSLASFLTKISTVWFWTYMLFCKAESQWPRWISKTLISFAVLLIYFIGQFIWLSSAQSWFQVPKTLSISLHTWTDIVKTLFSGQYRQDTLVATFFVVIIGHILFDNFLDVRVRWSWIKETLSLGLHNKSSVRLCWRGLLPTID